MPLLGETQEEDRRVIADLIISKMEVYCKPTQTELKSVANFSILHDSSELEPKIMWIREWNYIIHVSRFWRIRRFATCTGITMNMVYRLVLIFSSKLQRLSNEHQGRPTHPQPALNSRPMAGPPGPSPQMSASVNTPKQTSEKYVSLTICSK